MRFQQQHNLSKAVVLHSVHLTLSELIHLFLLALFMQTLLSSLSMSLSANSFHLPSILYLTLCTLSCATFFLQNSRCVFWQVLGGCENISNDAHWCPSGNESHLINELDHFVIMIINFISNFVWLRKTVWKESILNLTTIIDCTFPAKFRKWTRE